MAKGKSKDAEKEAAPHAEGAEGGEGAAAGKKKGPPMMVLAGAGVGALLLVGGGGVGLGVMLSGGKAASAPAAKTAPHKAKKPAAKDEKDKGPSPISEGPDGVLFYTMPDFVVNLQGPDSRPTYLKLSLAFEVADQDTADAITPDLPRLKDMFNGFLRELRPEDLSGNQGSYQLKMEIQRRVNLVIAPAKVNAVLINQMLIQ